jgi:hypothetical protein
MRVAEGERRTRDTILGRPGAERERAMVMRASGNADGVS